MLLSIRAHQRPAEGVDQRRLALVSQGSLTHPQPILVAVFLAAEVTLAEVTLAAGMPAAGMRAVLTMVSARTIHLDRTADPMDLRMM
jgi:hypothetical protein